MFGTHDGIDIPAFGDAHPATPLEVNKADLTGPTGIRLGYYRAPGHRKGWGDVIRYNGDGGLMLIAPPRMGKARDIQVGVLLDYAQSAIVIDPKGQLASITKAERERKGHRCIVLNPFNVCADVLGPTARYNPMSPLDPSADDFAADCRKLAEGVIASTNDKDGMHFVGGGRGLLAGVIGGLVAHGSADTKNLAYAREIISRDDLLLKYARASLKSPHAFIRQELATYAVAEPRNPAEVGAFKQTVREQSFFLGMDTIAKNVSESDFRFAGLKEGSIPTTVYVILPDSRLDVCGRWFRLIVASALDDLWRGGRGKHRVLMMLDEMAVIGRLDVLVNAAATAAGRGIQLFPVLQNIPQLQSDYKDVWETFLSGSDIRMFFAPRDYTTAEYISKMCGQRTITTAGQSINNNGPFGKSSESDSSGQTGQPLIRPHEVSRLGRNEFLMFGPEGIVIDALRRPYFHTPEFEDLYAPDPMHTNDTAPPPLINPAKIITFADALVASEERAARARRARRPMMIRLLTWGHSRNPFLNALLKIEYVLTLPLRLVLALLMVPFAIHNRPLGAMIGFLSLFGFYEVWNDFAKGPVVTLYKMKTSEYRAEALASDPNSMGNALYTHYRAAKWLVGLPLRVWQSKTSSGGSDDVHPSTLDGSVAKVSGMLDREAKKEFDVTGENTERAMRAGIDKAVSDTQARYMEELRKNNEQEDRWRKCSDEQADNELLVKQSRPPSALSDGCADVLSHAMQ